VALRYIAVDRLPALYETSDKGEKQLADQIIREWALSEDEGVRFGAIALIRSLKLRTAT